MNNKILSILVILVLVVGGIFLFMGRSAAPTSLENGNSTSTSDVMNVPEDRTPRLREFTVEGASFSFTPSTIRVNEGDTVRITFTNSGGMHDLKIDEFSVATAVLASGQSETIEFVATETGSFEYYCSVGNHRAMGMVGVLIVE